MQLSEFDAHQAAEAQALKGHEMASLAGVPRCVAAFDDPAYW
ncbi:hypothetical protein [Halomonas sp. PBN3]|nr:hypothetical protein [Halomonas sp. PBN3]ERS88970.1 hypothetical protein Q671_06565 [Halomonas sp. PBN3]